MPTYTSKISENKKSTTFNSTSKPQVTNEATFKFSDNRPETIVQLEIMQMANNANTEPSQKKSFAGENFSSTTSLTSPIQKKATVQSKHKENKTGLPDNLKHGIENLSGYSMDDVKVHYNSNKPAQLNAHAYAQGTDIHLASGQEKHLPHEAWHVVQQKQGRVKPTMQLKGNPSTSLRTGVNVNDDVGLEKEADVMGEKALQFRRGEAEQDRGKNNLSIVHAKNVLQRVVKIKGAVVSDSDIRKSFLAKTKDSVFVEWIEKVWLKSGDKIADSEDELLEQAYLAYLKSKGITPEESEKGDDVDMNSRFKKFSEGGEGKLVARSKEVKDSWKILVEMDAYTEIAQQIGVAVALPTPQLLKLPDGVYAIKMDKLSGEFIDLWKGTPNLILGKISKVVFAKKTDEEQKAVAKKLLDALTKLFDKAAEVKMVIVDLQGVVSEDGSFTLIDPLWAGPFANLPEIEHGMLEQMGRTLGVVMSNLGKATSTPAVLKAFLKHGSMPDAD